MGGPLRIVSVCRNLPTSEDPSTGIFVYQRLAAMARHSDVSAIHPIPFMPYVRPLPSWGGVATREHDGLKIENAPMFYFPGLFKGLDGRWLARSVAPIIERIHARNPIDLIDAHFGYPDGVGCLRVGQRLGIPVFITVRGLEADRIHEAFVGREMVQALRQAAGCVAVSQTLADLLTENGVNPERISVIHNAIDQSTFQPGDQAEARAHLAIDASRPLIVSVARLISLKRHHILLEAFSRVRSLIPDAVLAIVGGPSFEPKYPERLRRQVESLGLSGSVRFVGNLPPYEVVHWLRAADLFVLLSAREGCSNAVLEALAVGVPAIVTPAGDNASFVIPGENGEIVPIDDSAATAQALIRSIAQRSWDREGISQRLAAQVGNWDAVAQRVLQFFRHRLTAECSAAPQAV